MTPVTFDFETFWSTEFSLSKIPFMEYIMSPQFEVFSVAIKVGNGPTVSAFGEDVAPLIKSIDWSDKMAIAHNGNEFDFPLLVWKYNVHPKMFVDTLAMAKAKYQSDVGGSLRALSEQFGLPAKESTILQQTKGRRLAAFTDAEVQEMDAYNIRDTDNTYQLFLQMFKDTPKVEFQLMDMTARMIIYPQFVCNTDLLQTTLANAEQIKEAQLQDIAPVLGLLTADEVRTELGSAPKFAAALEALGVDPPMKISKTTGKQAYAFAKDDEGFTALLKHEDEAVQVIAAARLGVKSTLLETRLDTMLSCAGWMGGWMPVPLAYHAATTGRWGGRVWNPQNLPRINPKVNKLTDALRKSLCAPEGHLVVVSDLSGIELRVNHYLWGVESTRILYEGDPEADLYRNFASDLFGIEEKDVTKDQRQLAKMCLAEGTLILTRKHGITKWIPIESFTPDSQLWDGKEWVWAKGVVSNGWRPTQQLCGVWLTPDHRVLSGTQWLQAQDVRGERIFRALDIAAENLSLRALLLSIGAGSLRLSFSAIAGFLNTRLRATTSKISKRLGVIAAQKRHPGRSGTGNTLEQCRKMPTDLGYLTDYPPQSTAAKNRLTPGTPITAGGVLKSVPSGVRTGLRFLHTVVRYLGGTFQNLKWTASTVMVTTPPVTSGSSAAETTCSTNAKSQNFSNESPTLKQSLPVYDILDCGPRNRFTVLTNRGPMVVHNCQLGLGFGAGAATFKKVAKTMGGLELDDAEAERVKNAWRMKYRDIVVGWGKCQKLIEAMYSDSAYSPDPRGLVQAEKDSVRLPSGRRLYYPNLHMGQNDKGKPQYKYGTGRKVSKVYSGLMDENLVQAIARDVIAEQAITIRKTTGFSPCLMVHDELVYVVPEDRAEAHLKAVDAIMRTPPTWLPGIVLWSEGDIATTYGDAK